MLRAGRRQAVGGAGAPGPPLPGRRARRAGGGGAARAHRARAAPDGRAGGGDRGAVGSARAARAPRAAAAAALHRPARRAQARGSRALPDGVRAAKGSVAAPTAGLHFTPALLARLAASGVEIHCLTLHVGPGTFRPIAPPGSRTHRLEAEIVEIPAATAEAVDRARRRGSPRGGRGDHHHADARVGGRARTGGVRAGAGDADLFIYPGYRFRVVDALVTNFHLPRSTLLAPGVRLRGSRARSWPPIATPSPRAIASTRTATPC